MSYNVQKRSGKDIGPSICDNLWEVGENAGIACLQEAQNIQDEVSTDWLYGKASPGFRLVGPAGADLRFLLPRRWCDAPDGSFNTDFWAAMVCNELLIVNVHVPHVGHERETQFFEVLEEITHLILAMRHGCWSGEWSGDSKALAKSMCWRKNGGMTRVRMAYVAGDFNESVPKILQMRLGMRSWRGLARR